MYIQYFIIGGFIMLKLDERLSKIIQEASLAAQSSRAAEGITTLDFILAEIEDAKSELYSYVITTTYVENSDLEKILKSTAESLATEEGIQYPNSVTTEKNGKIVEIRITREMAEYIEVASKIAEIVKETEICTEDLMAAIINQPSKEITKLLRALQMDILELEKMYIPEEFVQASKPKNEETEIPQKMREYLSVVKGDKDISGRDEQIKTAWKILMKKTKRNFILVGEQGVGKTAIVYKMASQIEDGTAPAQFKDFKIFSVDVNAMISGTSYRGEAEERFKDLINFMKKNQNAILFIDEAHLILGAGACREGELDLANALKPVLAGEYSSVIAATTVREYEKYFSVDGAIKRRFEKVSVREPNTDEVVEMIAKKVSSLSKYHGVSIDKQTIHDVILYSKCFNNETKNPDRTLDLIDRSMVSAKLKGKTKVDLECILDNFEINLKAFAKTPYEEKLATAYHEMGHFLAFYFLPSLKQSLKIMAVSVYPAEDYYGITAIEEDTDMTTCRNKRAYVELIAAYLAGGIAESFYTNEIRDGISGDSNYATLLAKQFISKTGVMDHFFVHEEDLRTEKLINDESDAIKELLKEAETLAKELLQEHSFELKQISKKLVQKGIMTTDEIVKNINRPRGNKSEKAKA